ncbi:MAG TPA: SUMF1/EgtB/PvdO family nonheme iron enzyme [Candidatus Cybelea sp.]|nr:SUMF1/EgtB/PvdO family nonheme iron enzyme [Candidatus Cybelea sp.]
MTSQTATRLQPTLRSRLDEARNRTDAIFGLLPPNSFYDRPIPERHRLIFYLGHLEAFDWNLLAGPLGLTSSNPAFDKLFAFGIDPVGGGLPGDSPRDWPDIALVEKYNQHVRETLDRRLGRPGVFESSALPSADRTLLNVAIEHRLMHAETLAYLLHNLPVERKLPQPGPSAGPRPTPKQRPVMVPAGLARLGQSREAGNFGWDNEFETDEVFVPAFSVDVFPVSNGQYLEFIEGGGYEDATLWTAEDWEWKRRQGLDHPHFWVRAGRSGVAHAGTHWQYRAMFGTIPLPESWPVYVSQAEAAAYARWAGKKLPTEAQWHRAAYGTPQGPERSFPWGEDPPETARGNFHHQNWEPSAVDGHPAGASAFGVHDLLGNGWEWTSSVFGPLPGFQAFPFYPGYSANFFDGKHFVMKGGSQRTDLCMLRRPFRNWFQPHYPYVYAKFRCVED